MTIRERWISLLHRAASGTRTSRTLLTPLGVLIFGAFSALFVLAAVVVDEALGLPGVLPEVARWPVAIPVFAVGVLLAATAVMQFLRARGTPVPFNPPPQVIDTGLYGYARNPMLTGVFLVLFGMGFGFNSISLVLFFTPLYILVNVWELKNIEEPELERRLGEAYIEYRRKTPMFIPKFRR
jgi:protein-S-isoprenylcysteine O-methyltransferase Ste14